MGKAWDLYKIGKGLMGLTPNRVTVIIDKAGTIRDTHANVINISGHRIFIEKWLETLAEEESGKQPKSEDAAATPTQTAAAPEAS